MPRKLDQYDLAILAGYLLMKPRNSAQIAKAWKINQNSVYAKIKQVQRYWLLDIVRQPHGSHVPHTYQVVGKRPDA